jgi:hypothetical protein
MTNWESSRRDLLKSLGVGLAMLPALRFSHEAKAQTAGGKKDLALFIFLASEGYRIAQWKPPVGPLTTLPQSTKPLEKHKDSLIFLPDMTNPNYKGGERFGHEAYGSIFWGGASTKGSNKYQEPTASSFDQHIADNLTKKKETMLAFQLQLMRAPAQKVPGANRCFWRNGAAINPDANPTESFARIFAGVQPSAPPTGGGPSPDMEKIKRLTAQKKSILDYVGKSLTKFKTRVAREDQATIDQHFMTVRELEGQLATIAEGGGAAPAAGCSPMDGPTKYAMADITGQDKIWPDLMHAFMNIMLSSVVCNITNVTGLQVADSTGNQINFGAFVPGIPARGTGYKSAFRNWHDLGHNPSMGGVDHHRVVDEWCMNEFSLFLDKVKAVNTPSGNLLDNSVCLWANHMEDGASHLSQKVPWLLAGKAGGTLKTGQCAASAGKSIQGAMGDIIKAMGCPAKDPFTGSIGITA